MSNSNKLQNKKSKLNEEEIKRGAEDKEELKQNEKHIQYKIKQELKQNDEL